MKNTYKILAGLLGLMLTVAQPASVFAQMDMQAGKTDAYEEEVFDAAFVDGAAEESSAESASAKESSEAAGAMESEAAGVTESEEAQLSLLSKSNKKARTTSVASQSFLELY